MKFFNSDLTRNISNVAAYQFPLNKMNYANLKL